MDKTSRQPQVLTSAERDKQAPSASSLPPSAHFPDQTQLKNHIFTGLVYHATLAAATGTWEASGSILLGNCADLYLLQATTKPCPYQHPETRNPNRNTASSLSRRFQLRVMNGTDKAQACFHSGSSLRFPSPSSVRRGSSPIPAFLIRSSQPELTKGSPLAHPPLEMQRC